MKRKENVKYNLIFNTIYQVISVMSPLILTPKLSRVFGADYLGVKSYTFSIVYYFAVFGVLGLDMYGQRKIAIEKDNLECRSRSFWTIFSARFFMVFLSSILFLLFFVLGSSNDFEKMIFLCWIIYLVREMINPIWFLQGLEKYQILSVLGVVSQLLYVVASLIFIKEKQQLPLYIILYTGIPLLISIFYFTVVAKYVKFIKITIQDIIEAIRESIVYFVPTIATAIYSMIDKTMLGIFDAEKISTGLYEAAEKLVKVALAISTSSFTIMRTRMSYLFGQKDLKKYKEYCEIFISLSMLLCWPIMFGIIGISKDFVPIFFGNGFEEVISLSYFFSLVVPCLTISGLLQAIYIFPYGLQKTMDLYYVIIVLVNVIMNFILIRNLGTVGAIIASILVELLLAIILIVRARRDIEISLLFEKSIKYFIAAFIMYLYMNLVSQYVYISIIPKLIIEFCGAVIIYFIVCLLLRDSFVMKNLKKIFNK